MDNASDFESEDCEFESRRGQNLFFLNICSAKYTHHYEKESASARGRTVDLRFTRPTPYHLATKAYGDEDFNNTEKCIFVWFQSTSFVTCIFTYKWMCSLNISIIHIPQILHQFQLAWWRNGSASDSRSEGCVFKSRPGHPHFVAYHYMFK